MNNITTATEHMFWYEADKLCHAQVEGVEGAFILITFVVDLAKRIGPITVWNYDVRYKEWFSYGTQGCTPEYHNMKLINEELVPSDIRCMMLLLQGV